MATLLAQWEWEISDLRLDYEPVTVRVIRTHQELSDFRALTGDRVAVLNATESSVTVYRRKRSEVEEVIT